MADHDFAHSFIPDDMPMEDDEDLLAQMEMEAEEEAQQQAAHQHRMAGQSGPRKLDFASYGLESAAASTNGGASHSQQATQRLGGSLSLAYEDDLDHDMTSINTAKPASKPIVPMGLGHFERDRLEEEQRERAAASKSSNLIHPHPRATPSSMGAPSVLPPLHRSISELRAKVLDQEETLYVYRRPPAVGSHMTVTNEKGERVYITMLSQEEANKKLNSHMSLIRQQQMHRELGTMNVRNLMKELESENNIATLAASKAEVEKRQYDSDEGDDERTRLTKRRKRKERLVKRLEAQAEQLKLATKNKRLWVDKYTPKGYGDLLSPEQINREVLEWLKGWDTCVFGERKQVESAATIRTLDSTLLNNHLISPNRKVKKAKLKGDDGETDIRPQHKVILLCGPPGLGKTTLAHILAKQAGYYPYEINASDDRNAAVLESKIRAATEMQAVAFGADHAPRPNCIILDEIDGIADAGEAGAIAALIKIVTAEGKKKTKASSDDNDAQGGDDSDSEDESGGGNNESKDAAPVIKRRKSTRRGANGEPAASPLGPLKRPIICICNDQFAAALRPLRAIARIFEFTQAPKSKFVDRLKYIVTKEGMEYDPRTLGALADVVEMDIRSALNTLQFVHSKGQRLTSATLNNLAVGRKDVEKSRFQVWDAVFCDREVKKDNVLKFRNHRETERHREHTAVVVDEKSKVLQGLLSDAGDMDKIMEGIFHNYPTVGYPDPSFHRTVECADWLAYADLLEQRIQSEVEMSLIQYTPYAALAIHSLTARPRKVVLENPSMMYQQWVESQRNTQIIKSFLSPLNTLTLEGMTTTKAIMDIVPFILDIIHPTIRAVNFALLTGKEKNELSNLIDTMLSLSLTYRPEVQSVFVSSSTAAWNRPANEGVNVIYKLEPAIDLLSKWSNPLDAASAKKFEPKDRFGNTIQKGFQRNQPGQPPNNNTPTFQIDKRDINMPGKVKQMVLHELEHESMRRAEARLAEKFATEKQSTQTTDKNGANATPTSPQSFISPAVQKLLEEEKRKRARASEPAPTTTLTSPSATLPIGLPIDDESPATKRAKLSSSLNFLNAHADAAKKSRQQRNRTMRGATAASTKLDLAGLKTEKEEMKEREQAMDLTNDSDSATPSPLPPPPPPIVSSVLSRFTHPLHFKFNEGCTNAVRRTVQVSHFLPL